MENGHGAEQGPTAPATARGNVTVTASKTCAGPHCSAPIEGRATYHSRTCQQRAYRERKARRDRARLMRRTRPSRKFWAGVAEIRRVGRPRPA